MTLMLSGYPSGLYDDTLKNWKRIETKARIASGRGTDVRTECLWINPAAQHHDLFGGLLNGSIKIHNHY